MVTSLSRMSSSLRSRNRLADLLLSQPFARGLCRCHRRETEHRRNSNRDSSNPSIHLLPYSCWQR